MAQESDYKRCAENKQRHLSFPFFIPDIFMHLNLEPYLKPFCKYPICEFLGRHVWINRRKENPCCFVFDTPLQEGACKFIILPVCYNKLYLILRVDEVDIFHQEAPVVAAGRTLDIHYLYNICVHHLKIYAAVSFKKHLIAEF